MTDADFIKTDILIIGSGLAGLRCGISALEESPTASVLIVTKGSGPVGSSFTNINNALGIQVCLSDEGKSRFVKKAVSIASPGLIDSDLAALMAEESEESFHFLKTHHFAFNTDKNGNYQKYSGCFYPEIKGAFIFQNLSQAFHLLKKKYISLSGRYLEDHSLIHLLKGVGEDEKAVCGGIFIHDTTGECSVINARATVLASGGTTPLFRWHTGGRFLSGYSPALLNQAGTTIINATFHQFIWHHSDTFRPFSPFDALKKGAGIRVDGKIITHAPDKILSLIPERETHVPAAYGFPDTAIEDYLFTHADKNGIVTVVLPNGNEIPAVLCAHAWNGGAKIDQNGWTGVPGFYACGECAGGMHGANRIGGAMVLSTQVFGKRSGIHAARTCKDFPPFSRKECLGAAASVINRLNAPPEIENYPLLQQVLYQRGVETLCGKSNDSSRGIIKKFQALVKPETPIAQLLFDSAQLIL